MSPYADFTYFGLFLYLLIPTVVLGLFGRANARWALFASAAATLIHFSDELPIRPGFHLREWWIALAFFGYQTAQAFALLRFKSREIGRAHV